MLKKEKEKNTKKNSKDVSDFPCPETTAPTSTMLHRTIDAEAPTF